MLLPFVMLIGGCLLGCQVEGSRQIKAVIAGMEFSFSDTVTPNSRGEQVYKAQLTPEFLAWWDSDEEQAGPPEPATDSAEPSGGGQ